MAHNSIFGLGLIGAGTNNARLAATLRQLAQYHAKVEQLSVFIIFITIILDMQFGANKIGEVRLFKILFSFYYNNKNKML